MVRCNSTELQHTLICNSETAQQIHQALQQDEDSPEVAVTNLDFPDNPEVMLRIMQQSAYQEFVRQYHHAAIVKINDQCQ